VATGARSSVNIVDYEEIESYIEKGFISEQAHPDAPNVHIFNYTQACQFAQAWDDITRQCRGYILNVTTGQVLARPFPKFFNYGEHVSKGWAIPTGTPMVSEKLDGSLGILYALNGQPWIATRGSFISEQAVWATNWWRAHISMLPAENETHLFEIIYPQNRIVVSYDFSGLVHLETLDTRTGLPVYRNWGDPIRRPKTIAFTDVAALQKLDEPNSEGFVLYYPDDNVRMKIKFPEYVRLHKLVTGVSEIAIWEHLRDGQTLDDLLEKVPDEFFSWVRDVEKRLSAAYQDVWIEADTVTAEAMLKSSDRKERALYIQEHSKYPGICFAMLDGKDYKIPIWRMVRPRGQQAFKRDIDA